MFCFVLLGNCRGLGRDRNRKLVFVMCFSYKPCRSKIPAFSIVRLRKDSRSLELGVVFLRYCSCSSYLSSSSSSSLLLLLCFLLLCLLFVLFLVFLLVLLLFLLPVFLVVFLCASFCSLLRVSFCRALQVFNLYSLFFFSDSARLILIAALVCLGVVSQVLEDFSLCFCLACESLCRCNH